MRILIILGLAVGAIALAMPWLKTHIDDSGFRQDIAFVPGMVSDRHGVEARMVADTVRARARERGISLPPDGLTVTVSEGHKGTYRVAGGVMQAVGPPGSMVQDVSVAVAYDQPLLWVFKRHVETQVDTSGPGDGPASSYPPKPAPDAPPE
jgi:hypothetical protein